MQHNLHNKQVRNARTISILLDLEEEGWTIEQIANELGLNPVTIQRWFQGIAPYPRHFERLQRLENKMIEQKMMKKHSEMAMEQHKQNLMHIRFNQEWMAHISEHGCNDESNCEIHDEFVRRFNEKDFKIDEQV